MTAIETSGRSTTPAILGDQRAFGKNNCVILHTVRPKTPDLR